MLAHPTVISTLHVLCAAPGRPQGGRSRARLPAAGTQLAQLGAPKVAPSAFVLGRVCCAAWFTRRRRALCLHTLCKHPMVATEC